MAETLVIASHGLPDAGQAQRLRLDLPAGEWQWITRLRQPDDRLRSLAGRALARRLLAGRLGLAPAEVPLAAGPNGKPGLARSPEIPPRSPGDDGGPPGSEWHFNIAHSGSMVLVAIGPQPLGVDVETCPAAVDAALLRLVTGEDANEALRDPQAFCAEWACREAVLKACGLGLAAEPARLRLAADDGGWRRASGVPEAEGLRVRMLWQSPEHCAALCLAPNSRDAWKLLRLDLADWLEDPRLLA